MSLPRTLPDREYDRFTLNSQSETAVRIVGEVEITSGGGGGTKWRESFEGTTIAGTETTGITFIVGVSLTRQINQLHVTCYRNCRIRLKKGATLLASGRTASGAPNLTLNFSPTEPILSGETVTVTFEGLSGENNSDIEMFLSGTES